MESAIVGCLGLLLGVVLGEFFRRRRRIEVYAQKVFEKRLEIHEELHALMRAAYVVAVEVMEENELDSTKRNETISAPLFEIAYFTDDNELYLNRYLCLQAMTALMGAEDVVDIEDETEREAEKARILKLYRDTVDMISDEAGITQVNRHFKRVSKSSLDSDVIQYAKQLEKRLPR